MERKACLFNQDGVFGMHTISDLRGAADISDILPYYDNWYYGAKKRFAAQPNRGLAEAYFNRHRVHILKLAVIYEASRSASLRPTEASWRRAERAASWLENTIFSLLSTGLNAEGYAVKKMEDRILKAGADGLTLTDLTRAFQHDVLRQRHDRLSTLRAAGVVRTFQRKTPGRNLSILVHREFAADYQAKYPEDQAIG
jgi:hypothetical protein